MKRILVTGGAGYIGSHTVVELLNNGDEVVILDNLSNSDPKVIDRIYQITGKKVILNKIDLTDEFKLDSLFKQNEFDAVIHFAGLKSVGESVLLPIHYYHNNVVGTLTLLEVMSRHSCYKIIFSSSATVYGATPNVPIRENSPLSAINPYGKSKLFIEEILMDLCVSNKDWRVVSLRYFNPVAAHPSGLIGENPSGLPNNLLPYIAQVAVGKLDKLLIYGDDYNTIDGTGVRDYIHVVDLAQAHLSALRYIQKMDFKEENHAAFNVGTGQGFSVLEVLKAFEQASDCQIDYEVVNRRLGDVAECYAETAFSEESLEWKAKFTLIQMMEDHWRWQSKNPNGYR